MPAKPTAPPIEAPEQPGRINPALYIDRELSWIAFNRRVLEEAQDPRHPLLERVKFLAIYSANLDEFFMIRVSSVKKQIQEGVSKPAPSGLTPSEQYLAIRQDLLPLGEECQRLWRAELMPGLRAAGIAILNYAELNERQRDAVRAYYERNVFPVLTPLAIDASHPFPFVSNLNVNLSVIIDDPVLGELFARVKVPEILPRLVQLPAETCGSVDGKPMTCFVWQEEVIAAHLGSLFPGKLVREAYAFRVTRDTDLEIQEDEASDLLETMEETVRQRRFGSVVRLSLDVRTSFSIRHLLMENLEIQDGDVYEINGTLRLSNLMELLSLDRPDLKDPSFVPHVPTAFKLDSNLFDAIRQQPILLHHPFDSFAPVIDLVRAAARDPQVLAIKQTLYRVGHNAPIVEALMEARVQNKQVAVLVELKARFDEENNIEWARALEAAGVHVVYGLSGLKTHAKLLIIVRKEEDGLRRYVHLGTGNYNVTTAKIYTDFGLITADDAIGADVTELFNVLTGYSEQTSYRKLLVAPHGLRQALLAKIEREIERHVQAGDGHLIFKFNALVDETMIIALYRAAAAGVKVDLIIRGMCSLRPGIRGLSGSVTVRSIVGRFLEHDRVYYFHNGGQTELYLGSADLMDRNLDRRVEALFPVENEHLIRYLRDDLLETYLRDTVQARELRSDGTYLRLTPGDQPPFNAQQVLLEQAMHP